MLMIFADRHDLVKLTAPHPINHMVELGVYEGDFSQHCQKWLMPKRYTLIDFWDYSQYSFVLEDAPQMSELRAVYSQYFRDDPQKVLDAAYEKTRARFAEIHSVEILKMDIATAAKRFADASLDFIYLDGNHTYEFVLRDLHLWFPKLREGGIFVCNDFFESPLGARQNLGVIPAFLTFSKRYRTYPIVLTSSWWSDFYFSNAPSSDLIAHLRAKIHASEFPVMEVPDELLGAYHHEPVENPGQAPRLIPSFGYRRAP